MLTRALAVEYADVPDDEMALPKKECGKNGEGRRRR